MRFKFNIFKAATLIAAAAIALLLSCAPAQAKARNYIVNTLTGGCSTCMDAITGYAVENGAVVYLQAGDTCTVISADAKRYQYTLKTSGCAAESSPDTIIPDDTTNNSGKCWVRAKDPDLEDHNLNSLKDVTITSAAENDILIRNGSSQWVNAALSGKETDPLALAKLGYMNNGSYCTWESATDKINCNNVLPAYTDEVALKTLNNWCVGTGTQVTCTQAAPVTTESDPEVGTVTLNKWCAGTIGSQVVCDKDAPVTAETDPTVYALGKTNLSCSANQIPKWSGSVWACAADVDTDEVGTKTSGRWCTSDGLVVNCDTVSNVYNPASVAITGGTISGADITWTATTNTCVGNSAVCDTITTGSGNAVFGAGTGFNLTTGSQNTLLGSQSGNKITTGSRNTCIGRLSCEALETGHFNIQLTAYSGGDLITGDGNTAIGGHASIANIDTDTSFNSYYGVESSFPVSYGGFSAAVGEYNAFFGGRTGHQGQTEAVSNVVNHTTLLGYGASVGSNLWVMIPVGGVANSGGFVRISTDYPHGFVDEDFVTFRDLEPDDTISLGVQGGDTGCALTDENYFRVSANDAVSFDVEWCRTNNGTSLMKTFTTLTPTVDSCSGVNDSIVMTESISSYVDDQPVYFSSGSECNGEVVANTLYYLCNQKPTTGADLTSGSYSLRTVEGTCDGTIASVGEFLNLTAQSGSGATMKALTGSSVATTVCPTPQWQKASWAASFAASTNTLTTASCFADDTGAWVAKMASTSQASNFATAVGAYAITENCSNCVVLGRSEDEVIVPGIINAEKISTGNPNRYGSEKIETFDGNIRANDVSELSAELLVNNTISDSCSGFTFMGDECACDAVNNEIDCAFVNNVSATPTDIDDVTDVITATNTWVNGQPISYSKTECGLTAGTIYFVCDVTGSSFTIDDTRLCSDASLTIPTNCKSGGTPPTGTFSKSASRFYIDQSEFPTGIPLNALLKVDYEIKNFSCSPASNLQFLGLGELGNSWTGGTGSQYIGFNGEVRTDLAITQLMFGQETNGNEYSLTGNMTGTKYAMTSSQALILDFTTKMEGTCSFSIDNLSIKEVTGGDIIANGTLAAIRSLRLTEAQIAYPSITDGSVSKTSTVLLLDAPAADTEALLSVNDGTDTLTVAANVWQNGTQVTYSAIELGLSTGVNYWICSSGATSFKLDPTSHKCTATPVEISAGAPTGTFTTTRINYLKTINGGVGGELMVLHNYTNVRDTIIDCASGGNIYCNGGDDLKLTTLNDHLLLYFTGADWIVIGAYIIDSPFSISNTETVKSVNTKGILKNNVQSETCTPTGNGSAQTKTINPSSSYIEITNSDADGCDITIGETSMIAGMVTTLCVISNAGTTVNFADTAEVTDLSGPFSADINDCISLRYGNTNVWRQVSESAN